MKTLNDICEAIGSQLAGAKWKIDEPADPTGRWFADLTLEQRAVVIEWRPEFGYGISTPDDGDSYGTGPDEVYTDPVNVVQRVVELLREGGRTAPPNDVLLRDLREILNMTQQQLADAIGVGQANISKIEGRTDANLRTLRRIVRAMGGRLELYVQLPGRDRLRLAQFDEDSPAMWRLTS